MRGHYGTVPSHDRDRRAVAGIHGDIFERNLVGCLWGRLCNCCGSILSVVCTLSCYDTLKILRLYVSGHGTASLAPADYNGADNTHSWPVIPWDSDTGGAGRSGCHVFGGHCHVMRSGTVHAQHNRVTLLSVHGNLVKRNMACRTPAVITDTAGTRGHRVHGLQACSWMSVLFRSLHTRVVFR